MKSLLADYNKQYEDIIHSDLTDYQKGVRLGELMTVLEYEFRIPMLRNVAWEQENKTVIALYRKVSLSRKL